MMLESPHGLAGKAVMPIRVEVSFDPHSEKVPVGPGHGILGINPYSL